MEYAMVWPCAGPAASVCKISKSSVPWTMSLASGDWPVFAMTGNYTWVDDLWEGPISSPVSLFQVVLTRQRPLRDAKRRECMPERARNEGGRRLRYPPSYCHGQTADCDSLSLFDMQVRSRKRLLRSTCLSSGLRVKV